MAAAAAPVIKQEGQNVPTPAPQQQFCVRWNSYQTNLQNTFPKLLSSEHFVDVTLACEAEMIKCHKVVLSACSTYFEKLLVQNPCQHPIIFMKDMKYAEMQALVDFMYRGEVNVTQDELPSLLRSAEALQIRGLCGSDQLLSQHYLGNMQQQLKTLKDAQQNQTNTSSQSSSSLQTPTNPTSTQQTSFPTINGEKKEQNTNSPGDVIKKFDHTPVAPASSANGGGGGGGDYSRTGSPIIKREMCGGASSTDRSEDGDSLDMKPNLEPQLSLKEEIFDNDDSYYDNGDELMDAEFLEQDQEQDDDDINQPGTSSGPALSIYADKSPDYAIANVSCQYNDGSPGGGIPSARRIRRSEAELRRAAECITRGQTFQTVSDQFNIPISTIRFYMARKGILPRRKRGRACSAPGGQMSSPYSSGVLGVGHGTPLSSGNGNFHNAPGNTSPSGPPYHIVHYKLPVLGAKLK